MPKKIKPGDAVALLKQRYPAAECALHYEGDPWRLLMMARLSAQCTDARVNLVSEELFRVFPDANAMANGDVAEIERLICSCGLYHMKAKNLKDASAMLIHTFGGTVPSDMDALLSLPGVGRKIANLMRGDVFGLPAIVADTHCIRISNRMGFCDSTRPELVEKALLKLIPPNEQSDFCHRLVLFGRDTCRAQNPACDTCPFPCKQEPKKKHTRETGS